MEKYFQKHYNRTKNVMNIVLKRQPYFVFKPVPKRSYRVGH